MSVLERIGNALSPHRPGRTILLAWLFGSKPEDKWDVVARIVLGTAYFGVCFILARLLLGV